MFKTNTSQKTPRSSFIGGVVGTVLGLSSWLLNGGAGTTWVHVALASEDSETTANVISTGHPNHSSRSAFDFPQNFVPPGDGRPDNTHASGARGSCTRSFDSGASPTTPGIQAIMPSELYGLTFQEHPVIFMDFGEETAPSIELRIRSDDGIYDERVRLPVISEQDVQGFALPSDRPPLDIGKNYQWMLLVACDDTINPNHPIFMGWVQRVTLHPALTSELDDQTLFNQVNWYANHGHWYDIILAVQEELQLNPSNPEVQTLWDEILSVAFKSTSNQSPANASEVNPLEQ